jgi:hypothetical protein
MAMKPNLDVGNPAAAARNSPKAISKQKRTNLVTTAPTAKARNTPSAMTKNKEGQTMRLTPSSVPPRDMPDDARIHRELTTGKRNHGHARKGR